MLPKKLLILAVSLVLLVTAPFSIAYADESGAEADDYTYIAARNFFIPYGLNAALVEANYQINCSTISNGACQVGTVKEYNQRTFNQMSVPSGGTFKTYSSYNTSNRIRVATDPLYIVFLSSTNFTTSNVSVYAQNGYTTSFTRVTNNRLTVETPNGFYLIVLKLWSTNTHSQGYNWTTVNLPGTNSTIVIPLFYGNEEVMDDDIHRLVFGTGQTYTVNDPNTQAKLNTLHNDITSTNSKLDTIHTDITSTNSMLNTINVNAVNIRTLLSMNNEMLSKLANGTTESTSAVNTNDQQNLTLSDSITDLVDQEDSFMTSMDNSLQNVQMNNSIITNNHFLSSANWVRQQYNSMISNNPFGSLLYLCLSLGLSLLILGKLR